MLRNVLQPAPLPLDLHKIQAHANSNPQSAWRSGQSSPTPSNATLGSLSWFAERSATELIPLLKEAYSALREKERDLFLAAEIGKSLLENNITLKNKYESLLQQLQMYRDAQSRLRITNGNEKDQSSENLPDITIDETDDANEKDLIPDNPSYHDDDADSSDGIPRYSTSGLKPRARATSTSRAQQVATLEIEKLEKENMELQTQLESALKEADEQEKQNRQKQKQLEKELDALKSELGGATQKVEELEEEKEKLVEVKKTLTENGTRPGRTPLNKRSTAANEPEEGDDEVINSLLQKLKDLEQNNDGLIKTKSSLEQKLTATLRDLNALKQDFEQCEFTQDDYKNLQEAYQRQFKHIAELNESLEEHRNMLVSVREKQQLRGPSRSKKHRSDTDTDAEDDGEVLRDSIGSRYSNRGRSASARSASPSPQSLLGGSRRGRRDSVSSWSTVLSEAAEMMEGLMGMSGSKKGGRMPRKTLLSELENEWFRGSGTSDSHDESLRETSREQSVVDGIAEKVPPLTTDSDTSLSTRADSPFDGPRTAHTTPEPAHVKASFAQYLTSPGEVALNTLLTQTGFDRGFLDDCFELIQEAHSVGLFDDEFDSQMYPSSEFDEMEDRMGMMGMIATKDQSEVVERKGLIGWIIRLLRRIFRAIWRWCRFLGVLVAAVVISVLRGPDEVLLENGEEW